MKKSFLLVLTFVGYQFMVALLLIITNVVMDRPDPNELSTGQLILSSILSNVLVIIHLLWCRDARLNKSSFTRVPLRCYLLCLPLVLSAMFVLNVATEWIDLPNYNNGLFAAMSRNVWGVLSIVLVAPLAEELLFRGALERHLLKQGYGSTGAIVASSAFFAVVHGNPAQMPFAFLLGMLLAWLYYRTGSIIPGVMCHVINNGLAVWTMLTFSPEMSTEEIIGDSATLCIMMFLSAGIFAACFVWARRIFPLR